MLADGQLGFIGDGEHTKSSAPSALPITTGISFFWILAGTMSPPDSTKNWRKRPETVEVGVGAITDDGPRYLMLIDNPGGFPTVVLAHGSTTRMDSPLHGTVSAGLADHGLEVVRFEFPFMAAAREHGHEPVPDDPSTLLSTWREILSQLDPRQTFIGGKSLGARIASMLADEFAVRGLVCLGYPFHPLGQPGELRTTHMRSIATPTLIVQGTEDRFGRREVVESFELSEAINLHWLEAADHSFLPTEASELTRERLLATAVDRIRHFTCLPPLP